MDIASKKIIIFSIAIILLISILLLFTNQLYKYAPGNNYIDVNGYYSNSNIFQIPGFMNTNNKQKCLSENAVTSVEPFYNNIREGMSGSEVDPTPTNTIPKPYTVPISNTDNSTTSYNSYDTIFHESAEDIQQQLNVYIPQLQDVNVSDNSGNSVKVSIPKYLGTYTYYTPGSYKYSASSFVPSYEDSVYLSRSIGVVPKLDREYYNPSSDYRLNSIESPFTESSDLISTSSDWLSKTPVNNQLETEKSDNVNTRVTDDKLPELTKTYNMDKSDEVIAYEKKSNDLLKIQKKILSYATLAPLNVQPKIISPNIMSYSSTTPTANT